MQTKLTSSTMETRLTRNTDILLTLTRRAQIANAMKADAFVSVHCNAAVNRQAHGFEVFTAPGQNRGDVLAERIIEEVAKAFPAMRIRVDMLDGDRDKEARFTVLTRAEVPAALVEILFISNPTEEALLNTPAFQTQMAEAISEGIMRFLGIENKQRLYTVQPGDTLWSIAAARLGNGTRHVEIQRLNNLTTTILRTGQTLRLPD